MDEALAHPFLDSTSLFPSVPCLGRSQFFGSGFQRRSGVLATAFAFPEIQPLMEPADASCLDAEEPPPAPGPAAGPQPCGTAQAASAGLPNHDAGASALKFPEGWIPAYRGLGGARVAPAGQQAGPHFGLVSTKWDAGRLLRSPSWIVVLPLAHHGLHPDTALKQGVHWEHAKAFNQESGKYDPESIWEPEQAVYHCCHESRAIIAQDGDVIADAEADWIMLYDKKIKADLGSAAASATLTEHALEQRQRKHERLRIVNFADHILHRRVGRVAVPLHHRRALG